MATRKELERRIEHLNGQMVGVQVAIDSLVGATIETGATNPDTVKAIIRSVIEIVPTNPHLRIQEMASATGFLTSMLLALEKVERVSSQSER